MKLCVAQISPSQGDIQANSQKHVALIELAVAAEAEAIFFPELSLTGYEPKLAADLATHPDDDRFALFQRISDARQIVVGVGVPTQTESGVCISMLLFQQHQARLVYSKQYLHADEEPFFVPGANLTGLPLQGRTLALAICYELSVPEHTEKACTSGAAVYIASVAKSVGGIDKALNRLADIAATYSLPVLMANCVGEADGQPCAGKSSIWNEHGALLGQLDSHSEGLLLFDLDTQQVVEKLL